jgi:hypothetical protein
VRRFLNDVGAYSRGAPDTAVLRTPTVIASLACRAACERRECHAMTRRQEIAADKADRGADRCSFDATPWLHMLPDRATPWTSRACGRQLVKASTEYVGSKAGTVSSSLSVGACQFPDILVVSHEAAATTCGDRRLSSGQRRLPGSAAAGPEGYRIQQQLDQTSRDRPARPAWISRMHRTHHSGSGGRGWRPGGLLSTPFTNLEWSHPGAGLRCILLCRCPCAV